mmetsp:Transcript_13939/g.32116  ORF Transcript_13939/g.32116 Transcript_13939/m.32116 type:complete len:81 (-) Transcript_13939:8-250(-)
MGVAARAQPRQERKASTRIKSVRPARSAKQRNLLQLIPVISNHELTPPALHILSILILSHLHLFSLLSIVSHQNSASFSP